MSNRKSNDSDYLFLTAMIRAREAKMLTREKTGRILDSGSFEEAARILGECGYAEISGTSVETVETALNTRRAEIFQELEQNVPDKALVEIFRIKYDYHNAKVLIKAQGAGVDGGHLLMACGRVPIENIVQAFDGGDSRFLPEKFGAAVQNAKSTLVRTGNPQMSDFVLDKAYFAELVEMADQVGDEFLSNYVKLLIDSANLRAAVRVARMGRGTDFLKTALIPGGSVSVDSVVSALASEEGLAKAFSSTKLAGAAVSGVKSLSGGTMTEFELECDNAVAEFLKTAKYISFGVAPVAAYLAGIENEITTARMILTGFLAGIAPEILRERLRDSYV